MQDFWDFENALLDFSSIFFSGSVGFPEIFRHFYGFNLDSFKGFNGFSVEILE
jgi:hypothetical protein